MNVRFLGTPERPRLRPIGLFYAIATRSYVHRLNFYEVYRWDNEFVSTMLKSRVECLHIARDVEPRDCDTLVQLGFENLLPMTYIHRDESSCCHISGVLLEGSTRRAQDGSPGVETNLSFSDHTTLFRTTPNHGYETRRG